MKTWIVDEAAPPLEIPGELTLARDLGSAHLVILHVPSATAPNRVAEIRRELASDALLFVLTDSEEGLDEVLGAGADEHLVWPRDGALLRSRLRILARRLVRLASERKKTEAQLELADRMVSVGTLAAGVAHEINNPLAYVGGNIEYVRSRLAEVLASHPDLADLADLAELIVALDDSIEGADRMRAIVRDLRVFSRADENERSAVDVDRVIDVAVRMTQPALKHRAHVVKDSKPVPPVYGNAARLGQVIVNLLVNSVQAMPVGRDAAENEIRVATRSEGDRVTIELQDNGVGMSDDVQRRIFDPFYTTKPVGEGTGLGLWICRNTVNGMGGDIGVASAPGHGTSFQVRLPVAPSASQPLPPAPSAAPSSRRPRLRVLVLDDEPKMVAGLRRMLGDENDVVPFTDAREALARINAGEHYDAILCDLMMPGMDGISFFGELSRVAPAIAARTGFLSGGALTDPARVFVGEHAARWLQKPFEVDGLRAFVATLLSR